MMTPDACCKAGSQRGAATLLVALVLMMSITVITLSVARTQLSAQKTAINDTWNTRLSLQAEAGLAQAQHVLQQDIDTLTWIPEANGAMQTSQLAVHSDDAQIHNVLTFRRTGNTRDFILLESLAQRRDDSALAVRVSAWSRRLSVLTPLAEAAPPLIVNGCLRGTAMDFHIRPRDTDTHNAGEAAWLNMDRSCASLSTIDTHHGSVVERAFHPDFWSDIFSIDRDTFTTLAVADSRLPSTQAIYYVADEANLHAGRWSTSLGTPSQPVVLYVPSALGCPEFAPGVRIFGIVFIDTECLLPAVSQQVEIYGSLMINGDLDVTDASLYLGHITVADERYRQLHFPALRNVLVPGTWRDF